MKLLLASCMTALFAVGCSSQSEDDTLYLTGSEEFAVRNADGEFVCESPKKTLICHIPPGNPDNAHTICVGTPAVTAHVEHHGDPVGACEGEEPPVEEPPAEEPDAGAEPEPEPEADAGTVIVD
jgi:hypothetical protein